MLRLHPLLKAHRRLERISGAFRAVNRLATSNAPAAVALLPVAFGLRFLTRREMRRLERLGYPVRQLPYY